VKPRPVKFFKIEENKHPYVAKGEKETKIERGQGGARVDDHHPLALRTGQHRRREARR
jgi:hypothetical protein